MSTGRIFYNGYSKENAGPFAEALSLVQAKEMDTASISSSEPPVFAIGTCNSTFDVAWDLVGKECLPAWSAVIAYAQHSGRGQLRRHWHSPPGNLYITFVLPEYLGQLHTLAAMTVAYCVHGALQKLGIATLLKWPNDLLLNAAQSSTGCEGKFGGLLLEEKGDVVLAGLGLNMKHAPRAELLRPESAVPAVAYAFPLDPVCTFWLSLRPHLEKYYQNNVFEVSLNSVLEGINSALAWRGEIAKALEENIEGRIIGVADDGSLHMATPCGVRAICSGSILRI